MIKDYNVILEQYYQRGKIYILPIELVNIMLNEIEELRSENKHLLELQKSMDKQYEELENEYNELKKRLNQ